MLWLHFCRFTLASFHTVINTAMRSHTRDQVISKLDLLDLASSEQKRTKKAGDHTTSSQNKPRYLSKIYKNYTP